MNLASRKHLLAALAILICLSYFPSPAIHAQGRTSALADAEIEKLRDTAQFPPERIAAFIAFLDRRTQEIDRLGIGRRKPGREDDIHDQMEQFTTIADDLDDNLSDYTRRHADLRKALPKLIAATERWGTALKTPPEDERYAVSRKLALETLNDIHEEAVKMLEEEKAYFLTHPPPKDDAPRRSEPK